MRQTDSNFHEMVDASNGGEAMPAITQRGRIMRMMTGLGVLAGLACIGGPAVATTTTTSTFAVSLTIAAQCVINSTQTLAFGSHGVLGGIGGTTNNDAQSTIAVQCTDTTPFNIGLDAGTTTGADTTTRLLLNTGSSATVNYKLYTENTHTTNWGNNAGVDTLGDTGNGASVNYTVYGRIPPQTTPAPGTYADTVTVTVTY
jgi:spore coat protein U-like protein